MNEMELIKITLFIACAFLVAGVLDYLSYRKHEKRQRKQGK